MADYKIQDILWTEVITAESAVPQKQLAKAKETLEELNSHGIQKMLYNVLLDKGFISLDECKRLSAIINGYSFRCPNCREKVFLKKFDSRGAVKCDRCKAKIRVSISHGKEPIEKRITTEIMEKPDNASFMPEASPVYKHKPGNDTTSYNIGRSPSDPLISQSRNASAFFDSIRSETKTISHRELHQSKILNILKAQNPVFVLAVSLIIFGASFIFLFSRYTCWAEESNLLSAKNLVTSSGEFELASLMNKKDVISKSDFVKQAQLLASAYEGTPVEDKILKFVNSSSFSNKDKMEKVREYLAKGWILQTIALLNSMNSTPSTDPEIWSEIHYMAEDNGQIIQTKARINLPGIETFFSKPFFIDKHPVTNQEYFEFVNYTGNSAPSTWKNGNIPANCENKPVSGISFKEARIFARWKGKRLPREYELRLVSKYFPYGELQWCSSDDKSSPIYPLAMLFDGKFNYKRFHNYDRPEGICFRCVTDITKK